MTQYPDYHNVQQCLLKIEKDLEWGDSEHWHNEVFNELSLVIQNKTLVLLSPSTLKRVWGKVNYNSTPSISTLNTLAQFAGFLNWRDFKQNGNLPKPDKPKKSSKLKQRLLMIGAFAITLIFISFFPKIDLKNGFSSNDLSDVIFTSHPLTEGMPNSVVFDLDLQNIASDSLHIQQYWDPSKTIKLKPNQNQATGIYYFPGYFRAKLLVDGEIIKEHDLFIKSSKWSGMIEYDPIPKYLENSEIQSNGLSLPENILDEIKSSDQALISTYHLIDDFGQLSGDNFELESTIQNVYNDKWAVCQTAQIYILGTKGAMIIPITRLGCVSDVNLMLNDVFLSGKENSLAAFGYDISSPSDIKISVSDKVVKIAIEENEIFTGTYTQTMGRFVGLRYKFLGAGKVTKSKVSWNENESTMDLLAWENE